MPLHPLLLALYPVLHLLSANIAHVSPRAALGPVLVTLVAAAVVWPLCALMVGGRGRGALGASAFWVLFFSHGHVLGWLGGGRPAGWFLLGGGAVVFIATVFGLRRWSSEARSWNRALNVPAVVLVLLSLGPVVAQTLAPARNLPVAADETVETPLGYLPDIYIVVLDAFGRADVLQETYDVDLGPLTAHLASRGFAIADQARANYNQTALSLASFFNSEHIRDLMPNLRAGAADDGALRLLTRQNRHVARLRGLGYQLVTLTGGSELAVLDDPDVNYRGGALNEFQSAVLAITPLPLFAGVLGGGSEALDPFAQHRQSVKWQLAKLPHVQAPEAGPKLVFAHILTPHPPFVIGADGEDKTPDYEFSLRERMAADGYVAGYAGQAAWLARELQKVVDGILAASSRPPVIVIMGDHGPASKWLASWKRTGGFGTTDPAVLKERMSIFLAVKLPEGEGTGVYPEMTPINVFPLVYERVFGETFTPRADRAFFATYEDWAAFRDVDRLSRAGRRGGRK